MATPPSDAARKFDPARAGEYETQSRIALAGYDACHELAACMLAAALGTGTAARVLVVGAGGGAREIVTAGALEPGLRLVCSRQAGPQEGQFFGQTRPMGVRGAMKRKRFSEEQIAFALRQAEAGSLVEEICRKLGISEPTFYRWKKRYAGMGVPEIRRLKQLEDENKRLKQLVADLSLDKTMLQDVVRRKW
jgi:putative transposase